MLTEFKVYIDIDSLMYFIYSFKRMCQARTQAMLYSDINIYI